MQLPPQKSLLSKADGIVSSSLLNDIVSYNVGKLKTVVLTAQRKKLLNVLVAKSLHGNFFSLLQSPDVNNVKSFRWLLAHCITSLRVVCLLCKIKY